MIILVEINARIVERSGSINLINKIMKEYKTNLPKLSLLKEATDIPRAKIKSSSDCAEYSRKFYGTDIEMFESMFIILLNNSNNTIGYVKISQGVITGTVVDVRIICKYAIEALAVSIIMVHNHPSGTLKPSGADIDITAKVKKALETLDIKLLDHIIIIPEDYGTGYFSFADENLI